MDRLLWEQPDPWEQQDGEPSRCYRAFSIYRDLGPKRTLIEACRRIYPNWKRANESSVGALGRVREWAKKYRWEDRSLAWDRKCDQEARNAHLEEIREVAKRQATQARQISAALQAPVIEFLRKIQSDPEYLEEIAKDPVMLLKAVGLAGKHIPAVQQAERRALIGGDGALPSVYDEDGREKEVEGVILEVYDDANEAESPTEQNHP